MRIYITHFFLLDGTGVLPSCPSSAFCTKSVIFEVLTTKMAGRVAFGEKTKYLFRQRKETIMGIAIGGQNFHIFVKSSESIEEQRWGTPPPMDQLTAPYGPGTIPKSIWRYVADHRAYVPKAPRTRGGTLPKSILCELRIDTRSNFYYPRDLGHNLFILVVEGYFKSSISKATSPNILTRGATMTQ